MACEGSIALGAKIREQWTDVTSKGSAKGAAGPSGRVIQDIVAIDRMITYLLIPLMMLIASSFCSAVVHFTKWQLIFITPQAFRIVFYR